MSHWRATGGKPAGGGQVSRPHSEPGMQHGPNIIRLADHQPASSPDDRSNSERLTVAPSFIREFAAVCFGLCVILAPVIFVGAAILFYALMVA